MLTTLKGINEIRYATMPNMIRAARYKPEVWGASQLDDVEDDKLGLKGSPTWVSKSFTPPPMVRAKGEILTGTAAEIASKLVDKLVPVIIVPNK